MLKSKRILLILVAIAFITSITALGFPVTTKANSTFTNFITRSGDKLMDGSNELRFISINVPNFHFNENGPWSRIDPWEQEDILKSVVQMGGTVIRQYTFTFPGNDQGGTKVHYYSDGNYDSELFSDMDTGLQLAQQYGIRVIVPFIDKYSYWGGIYQFSSLNGGNGYDFYTNPVVKQRFKNFVSYVVNRYKNNKAILAWELGNELTGASDAWTQEMAAFVKSIDPNHLVSDNRWCADMNIPASACDNPDVDIIDNHFYGGDYVTKVNTDRNTCKDKKVYIVGEFGYAMAQAGGMSSFLDELISNGTSGAMIWSLRSHSKDGGFYFHVDAMHIYHWPGINKNETDVTTVLRQKAYQIRNLSLPSLPIPDAPVILSNSTIESIKWKGSAGAQKYDIERASNTSGPWSVVGTDVLESTNPYKPFSDMSAAEGQSYYYRVKAKNVSGISAASNVVGPITAPSITEGNLALNKVVTASSILVGYEASKAVDGSTASRWSSVNSDPQGIYVDLGDTYTINRVLLYWEAAYGKAYKLQVSNDAANWTDIYSTTTGDGGIDDLTGLSGSGRYVRMYGTQRGTLYGYSLLEFGVYGSGGVTPAPSGSIVDEMNDFTKSYSHTASLTFDAANTNYFAGDKSRLVRTSATYENIVYHTPGNINYMMVDTYFWPNEAVADFKFYTSNDGTSYTEYVPDKTNLGGNWTRIKYESSSLPTNTKYLKIEFRNTSVNNWNPQISKIQIDY